MSKTKWDRRAPFLEGCLQHYPQDWRIESDIEWRDEQEFKATMTYHSFTRGRSAAYILLIDDIGREQPMFLAEFHDVVPHLVKGSMTGIWTVTKRGMNFGLKLVETKSGK
jgi:hypothetical protein